MDKLTKATKEARAVRERIARTEGKIMMSLVMPLGVASRLKRAAAYATIHNIDGKKVSVNALIVTACCEILKQYDEVIK